MLKLLNGKYIEMTEEEIIEHNTADGDLVDCPPTTTERISALESAVADIAVMLVGGAENG